MANPPAPDISAQTAPAAPSAPHPEAPAAAPPKDSDQVTAALALGRQMTQLYVAVANRHADISPDHRAHIHPPPPAVTGGLGPLDDEGLFRLRLTTVQAALYRLSGVAAEAGIDMPTADHLIAADNLSGDAGCEDVATLHRQLIEKLCASSPPMGTAYELGSALAGLCEATCRDATEFQAAINAGRIDRIRTLISRLRSILPPHSAEAVSGALDNWEDWLAAGTIGGQPINWQQDGPTIAQALYSQGSEWFSILTGQKNAVDLLSIDNYVTAGEGMVRQYRHLGGRFLAQWWPWLAGAILVAGVVVFLFLYYGRGSIRGFGTIATLLAGIGVTAKTATSTLEKTASDIGNSLWQAELDSAIVLAATSLPAGDPPVVLPVNRPCHRGERKAAQQAEEARNQAVTARATARAAQARAATRGLPLTAAPLSSSGNGSAGTPTTAGLR